MNLKQLRDKRATLLREADGLKVNGEFKDDHTRAAFDAKMTEIEQLDAQIRTAEEAERQAAAQPTHDQIRAQAVADERKRGDDIRTAVRLAKLPPAFGDELVTSGKTVEQARAAVFAKLAETEEKTPTRNTIAIGEDAKAKWLRGATNWLLVRSGMAGTVAKHEGVKESDLAAGEFRGMSLLDLARESLLNAGRTVRGMDRMRLIGEALTLRDGGMINQGTSDFAVLLENALFKVLQAAYATTPDTWRRFCAQSSVVDFRVNPRYRMGNFSVLDSLNEQGEFKQKGISDAEKATIQAATKGNIIAISRQAIVNDDMNFFSQVPARMGRAAALSVEVDVYALLALNSNTGPSMPYDSTVLFHANHGNISTGAALSAAAIDADRVAMASQKEPNGNDYIDLRPAVLLVPVGLGGVARVINQSQYDPDTVANKSQMKPNVVAGLFRDVVDTPRLTGTRRYLFADPAIAPVLEVAFLEGQSAPVLESQDGWRVDGAEMKVRFDYGVAAVDHRGAVTNAGV
jgi:hypothetical protein